MELLRLSSFNNICKILCYFVKKSYIFRSLSFENCMRKKVSPMCLLSSDKQPKMKYFISLFYSNLKCLHIRLFILFEHTYYIFIQLVLVKDLFQTKKRNCFLLSDFKRNRLSDILQQPTLARNWRAFGHKFVVFSTETKGISVNILT